MLSIKFENTNFYRVIWQNRPFGKLLLVKGLYLKFIGRIVFLHIFGYFLNTF